MSEQNLLLFKQDMLQWASQILEVPIQSINEFRNGVYFIELLRNLNHKYSKTSYFDTPSDQDKVYHNLTLVDLILKQVSKYSHSPTTYPDCEEEILYFDLDVMRSLINQYVLNNFDKIKAKLKKCQKLLNKNCHPISKLSSLYQLFDINKIQHLSQDIDYLKDSQELYKQFEEGEFKPQNLSNSNLGKIEQVDIPNLFNSPPVINTNLFQQQKNDKNLTSSIQQTYPKSFNDNFHLQNLSTTFNRQNNSLRLYNQPRIVSQQEQKNSLNSQQQQEGSQQITDQINQEEKKDQTSFLSTLGLIEQLSSKYVMKRDNLENKKQQQNIFNIPQSQELQNNQKIKISSNSPQQQNQNQNSNQRVDQEIEKSKKVV